MINIGCPASTVTDSLMPINTSSVLVQEPNVAVSMYVVGTTGEATGFALAGLFKAVAGDQL